MNDQPPTLLLTATLHQTTPSTPPTSSSSSSSSTSIRTTTSTPPPTSTPAPTSTPIPTPSQQTHASQPAPLQLPSADVEQAGMAVRAVVGSPTATGVINVAVADEKEKNLFINEPSNRSIEIAHRDSRRKSRVVIIDTKSIVVLKNPESNHKKPSAHVIADRLFATKHYVIMCIVLVIINLFLFIYGLTYYDDQQDVTWYVAVDISTNVLLALEVLIRIVATNKTYWRHWWNILDFTVMVVCLFTLFLYAVHQSSLVVHEAVVAVRYMAQLFRFYIGVRTIRSQKGTVKAANNLSIDFSTIQQESRRDSISSYLQSTSASSSEKSVRAPNLTSLASLIAPQPNNVNGHDVNGLSGMRGVHDVNGHLPGGKAENRAGVDDQE